MGGFAKSCAPDRQRSSDGQSRTERLLLNLRAALDRATLCERPRRVSRLIRLHDRGYQPNEKRRQKLAPKTIANHLRTLSAMFEYARRRRRMTINPVGLLEPLSVPTPETPVLREQEVAALLNAYRVQEQLPSRERGCGGLWRGA